MVTPPNLTAQCTTLRTCAARMRDPCMAYAQGSMMTRGMDGALMASARQAEAAKGRGRRTARMCNAMQDALVACETHYNTLAAKKTEHYSSWNPDTTFTPHLKPSAPSMVGVNGKRFGVNAQD